jgi:hypothetical protein
MQVELSKLILNRYRTWQLKNVKSMKKEKQKREGNRWSTSLHDYPLVALPTDCSHKSSQIIDYENDHLGSMPITLLMGSCIMLILLLRR